MLTKKAGLIRRGKLPCYECYFQRTWSLDYFIRYVQLHIANYSIIISICMSCVVSRVHFTMGVWAHNPNLEKKSGCSCLKYDYPIRSQFCIGHDSWAVVTCANLLSDWMNRIMITAKIIFKRCNLWALKLLVTWAEGSAPYQFALKSCNHLRHVRGFLLAGYFAECYEHIMV